MAFLRINAVDTFWATFRKKLGYFLLQHLVTLPGRQAGRSFLPIHRSSSNGKRVSVTSIRKKNGRIVIDEISV